MSALFEIAGYVDFRGCYMNSNFDIQISVGKDCEYLK